MNGKLLMTPGPTNVPERVLKAMASPMIHHRTSDYVKLFAELNERLKFVFQTKNPVLMFPAAGTGGLEASIVNSFSPGDKVLGVSIGEFGDRFIKIAKIYGLQVDEIHVPWGEAVTLDEIKNNLKDEHKGVFITHGETSTGGVNPVKDIGAYLKDKDKLFIVDAVSSLGAIDIKMDEWNIDVLITASQKALMCPPGLFFVGLSDKAMEAARTSTMPRFYFDFLSARKFYDKGQNPYTPAVSLVAAQNEALKIIEEEGLSNVFKRHDTLAKRLRDNLKNTPLKLFTKEYAIGNNLTVFSCDIEGSASIIKSTLESDYDILIAGGQSHTAGKVIRIGHMGYVNEEMIDRTSSSIIKILSEINK